jgi:DNA helicase-2/ATP-dependent DNA helicase PcrA
VLARLSECHFIFKALNGVSIPPAAAPHWSAFCATMARLRDSATPWIGQLGLLRQWYQPHLERLYDHPTARVGDLEKLDQISAGYETRERFLTELTLDPRRPPAPKPGHRSLMKTTLFCRRSIPPRDRNGTPCSY